MRAVLGYRSWLRVALVVVAVAQRRLGPSSSAMTSTTERHHQVAAIIHATGPLRADPATLLAEQAPGLRVVPSTPAPGDAA